MQFFAATAALALGSALGSGVAAGTGPLSFLGVSSETHGLTSRQLAMMPEKHTLDNMEATVLRLAAKRQKGEASAELDAFLDEILNITNTTMKVNILERKDATQAELNALSADFDSGCTHPSDQSLYTDLNSYNDTHIGCRIQEAGEKVAYDRCASAEGVFDSEKYTVCQAYETAKAWPNPSTLCQMAEGTATPTIGNYLYAMRDEYYQLWLDLKEKREACENQTGGGECYSEKCAMEDKNMECDGLQGAFEQEACQLSKTYTCSAYSSCYANNKGTYDTDVSDAQDAEAGYKAEWRAVMRIECLIKAMYDDVEDIEAEINTCKAKRHSTEPVELDYPMTTAQAESECVEDDYNWRNPSKNEMFTAHWYSALPAGASAERCACSCCGQENFVPSYPADVDYCPWTGSADANEDDDANAEMPDPGR